MLVPLRAGLGDAAPGWERGAGGKGACAALQSVACGAISLPAFGVARACVPSEVFGGFANVTHTLYFWGQSIPTHVQATREEGKVSGISVGKCKVVQSPVLPGIESHGMMPLALYG